jgi:hypothetical protein
MLHKAHYNFRVVLKRITFVAGPIRQAVTFKIEENKPVVALQCPFEISPCIHGGTETVDKDKGSALSGVLEMDLSAVVVIEAFDAFGKGLRLREGGTTNQNSKGKDYDGIRFHASDISVLVYYGQQAHEVLMPHAAAGVAVEGKGPDLIWYKLKELAFPCEDGSAI